MAGSLGPDPGVSAGADAADLIYKIVVSIGGFGFLAMLVTLARRIVAGRRAGDESRVDVSERTSQATALSLIAVAIIAVGAGAIVAWGDVYSAQRSDAGGLTTRPDDDAPAGVLRAPRDLNPPHGPYLKVAVTGRQYLWRYTYTPQSGPALTTYHTLVVPEDTTVMVDITSSDVTHSWWVPALGGRFDAVPGYINKTWFKVSRPGVYEGSCAELCGANHADMTTRVRVVTVAEFEAWLDRLGKDSVASRAGLAESLAEATGGADGPTGATGTAESNDKGAE